MYIGIFDQDIQLYPSKFIPSLELMKISAYHKKKKDIVEFCITLEDTEKYDKLYLSRNSLSSKDLPTQFLLQPNIEWVGRGFIGSYVELPKEIEECQPDKTLYLNYVQANKMLFSQHTLNNLISNTLAPNYVLLRITNGNKLLIDYTKLNYEGQNIILYDYDFFLSSHAKNIIEFFFNKGNKIYFIYSSFIEDLELLKYVSDKVFPVHRMKQVAYFKDNNSYNLSTLVKYIDYFNKNIGLYESIYNQQVSRNQFTKIANFYFLGIAKNKSIKIKCESIEKNDFNFYKRLIFHFCDFTQITSKQQDITMLQRTEKRNKKFYKMLSSEIKKDQILYNLCNTNVKVIHERGIWNYGI